MTGFHFWVECGEINMCNAWGWSAGSALGEKVGSFVQLQNFDFIASD